MPRVTTVSIPDTQLETWSHQGAIQTSKNTYASIKSNLEASSTPYYSQSFDIFLQGSYGNDTNIRADSDVDVVMMLTSSWRRDISELPQDQANAYARAFSTATYQFSDFRNGVVSQLQKVYGYSNVKVGNKSVKIAASPGRLGADIVVCQQYRYYRSFYSPSSQSFDEGIIFPASTGGEIINYPKLHSQNCTDKHQNTGQVFKPTVRVFKNMRGRLIDARTLTKDIAPSYFIEGMLYNVPNDQFSGSLGDVFCNCINWLRKTDRSKFVCPNRMQFLFGATSVQWDNDKCGRFLDALADLWNGWR